MITFGNGFRDGYLLRDSFDEEEGPAYIFFSS